MFEQEQQTSKCNIILKRAVVIFTPLFLYACATPTRPSEPDNICAIFAEKPEWKEAAEKARERWGAPPQITMAMMYQESSFKADARPPRDYILGFVPWGRVSSAYGYAQAKDEVWSEYVSDAGSGWSSSRDDIADALDFMGWYMSKSAQRNSTSKWDAYNQYLNYHEGWGGFSRKTYLAKPWLMKVATIVKDRAERYGAQYQSCR